MSLFRKVISQSRKPEIGLPSSGLYHFRWSDGSQQSRLHLRIDEDGSGLLIINANRVLHLNPTASSMAYLSLNKVPDDQAVKALAKRYSAPKQTLQSDFQVYKNSLSDLIDERACPVCDLDLETMPPFTAQPSAPYRMDIALTYRCNNDCGHCYNARVRSFPELDTQAWYGIIDHLWEIGIPHIVFTGGEPTLRDDLPLLINHAEKNGQITGLNTNGRRLSDPEFVNSLVDAGLDHVQITFESHLPEIHDQMVHHPGAWQQTVQGIRNALSTRLYVMTNTTMLTDNYRTIPETIEFLAGLGVPTVGLNALIYSGRGSQVGTGLSESQLHPLLSDARRITDRNHQKLIWYTPTQYCQFDPIEAGLGVKGCTAALYNMCLEPDGSVLPCQSYYQSLGRIQELDWSEIWNHELCLSLRERKDLPGKCSSCLIRSECGGGCPLTFDCSNN